MPYCDVLRVAGDKVFKTDPGTFACPLWELTVISISPTWKVLWHFFSPFVFFLLSHPPSSPSYSHPEGDLFCLPQLVFDVIKMPSQSFRYWDEKTIWKHKDRVFLVDGKACDVAKEATLQRWSLAASLKMAVLKGEEDSMAEVRGREAKQMWKSPVHSRDWVTNWLTVVSLRNEVSYLLHYWLQEFCKH